MIYLDHAATTPVDDQVVEAMKPFYKTRFGNPSSLHSIGRDAKEGLEQAREVIAKKVNAKDHKVVFTSGGTESNNFALKGVAFANRDKGKHIITTKVEHDCVLNSCRWLEKQGFNVTYLDVDKQGFVSVQSLQDAIVDETTIVSIIHGNNEIGTIQNLNELSKVCADREVYFHTDACQSFTKVPIDVANIDLLTINSHKIYGPRGVGALVIKDETKLDIYQHGGGQEFNLRSGTQNISGIVGFAKAVEIMSQKDIDHMTELRDLFIKEVPQISDSWLNGPEGNKRLCNNTNFSFKYIEGESLLLHLDAEGIATSTGSACSSKKLEPSHVLTAIGLIPEEAHGSLRLTTGKETKKEDIKHVIDVLKTSVEALRKISPLTK